MRHRFSLRRAFNLPPDKPSRRRCGDCGRKFYPAAFWHFPDGSCVCGRCRAKRRAAPLFT